MNRCASTGKIQYPDKKAAQSARNFSMRHRRRDVKELYIYVCPDCLRWHQTKNRQS